MKNILTIIIGLILSFVVAVKPVWADLPVAVSSAELKRDLPQADTRVQKLKTYLESHNSPLTREAEIFIATADKYSLDWRLTAAIAGVESTFGKRIPKESYNAWGFGIPTGQQSGLGFENWEQGIETVSQALKENYIDRGADDIYEIGRIYAPPSRTWAAKVLFFMEKIDSVETQPDLTI